LTVDITGDIMTRKKLVKLRRELQKLRGAKYSLKTSQLTAFAGKIGRKRDSMRGKEPTYVSTAFPELNNLSIPGHPTINPFTADSIMDVFEADLDRWESWVEQQESKENENTKKLPPATIRKNRNSSGN
jgi:hypothetical protein